MKSDSLANQPQTRFTALKSNTQNSNWCQTEYKKNYTQSLRIFFFHEKLSYGRNVTKNSHSKHTFRIQTPSRRCILIRNTDGFVRELFTEILLSVNVDERFSRMHFLVACFTFNWILAPERNSGSCNSETVRSQRDDTPGMSQGESNTKKTENNQMKHIHNIRTSGQLFLLATHRKQWLQLN